jgi:predicted DNA-binding transcriptional regulator YafY
LLLQQHEHAPEAVAELARSCSISPRQAYRYFERAERLKAPVPVEDAKVAFTVKLSRSLVQRLRMYAASTGLTYGA